MEAKKIQVILKPEFKVESKAESGETTTHTIYVVFGQYTYQEVNYQYRLKNSQQAWNAISGDTFTVGDRLQYEIQVIDKEGNVIDTDPFYTFGYVQEGLVLELDGWEIPKGTVWQDTSGHGYDATLVGVASYNAVEHAYSTNSGSIQIPRPKEIEQDVDNITMEVIIRFDTIAATKSWGRYLSANNGSTGVNPQLLNIWYSPVDGNVLAINGIGNKLNTSINTTHYYHLAGSSKIQNYTENHLYVDSLLQTNSNSQKTEEEFRKIMSFAGDGMMRANEHDFKQQSTIKAIRIYNKRLTEKELKQNYEIDKIRFALD